MTRRRQAERNVRKTPTPSVQAPARAEPRRPRASTRARTRAWRDHHLYGLFSSLGRLSARPVATALTALMLGFAIAMPLVFYIAFDNARDLAGGLRAARDVTAFLKTTVATPDAQRFADELRRRDDVADVSVRTPAQGLEEFRQLSGFGEALDILKDNPLPNVLVIAPRRADGNTDPAFLDALRKDPRVDLVQYDATWRRRLSAILMFGERAVAVIAVLLALATLLVIGNTVRTDIQSRSDEIAVMQLVGASDGFVRRPFLYTGVWYGLLGGFLALIIVIVAESAIAGPLERLLASYDHALALKGLGATTALVVIGASALLGWAGALIATARHLAEGHPE